MKSRAKNAVQARASSSVGLVDDAIDRLFNEISPLITAARERVAVGVNTELTKLNWNVGNCINREILGCSRAEYGKQVVKGLASRLMLFHGSGWDEKTLRHCLRAAETFGEEEIVAAARRQLSWTHIKTLSYISDSLKRQFYLEMCAVEHWGTRALQGRGLILCAGKNEEHVELLEMGRSNIRVASYMTELPPKKVLEAKFRLAIEAARNRMLREK